MGNVRFSLCALLVLGVTAYAIDWQKPCKEGDQWKDKCHTCHCANGRPVCTRELCESEVNTVNEASPVPLNDASNPNVETSCTPGEKWNEDCNDCICDNFGEPECSRRLCGKP